MLDLNKEIIASNDDFEVRIISTNGSNKDYPIIAEFKKKGCLWWYIDSFNMEGKRVRHCGGDLFLINSDPFARLTLPVRLMLMFTAKARDLKITLKGKS